MNWPEGSVWFDGARSRYLRVHETLVDEGGVPVAVLFDTRKCWLRRYTGAAEISLRTLDGYMLEWRHG